MESGESSTFKFQIAPGNLLPADPIIAENPDTTALPPSQLPEELIPKNIRWNPLVRDKVAPLFVRGCERGIGRFLYSEIDTAIEQRFDGDWLIGSALTKDACYWKLSLQGGTVTATRLTADEAAAEKLEPGDFQRGIDTRFELRSQPIISFESADFAVTTLPDGQQQVVISLLCKERNAVVFDTTQLVMLTEAPGQAESEFTRTRTIHVNVPWTAPPSGWQTIETVLPADRAIKPGTKIRIQMNAFAYQPRPSFYRISNLHVTTWNPPGGAK